MLIFFYIPTEGKGQDTGEENLIIGDQEWSSRNLDTMHYNNGDSIPRIDDAAIWNSINYGAYCYYENDTKNGRIYGVLYNWNAVNDPRGITPDGWRLPTYWDMLELVKFLNDSGITGKALKHTTGWGNPEPGSDNSKFSALPGGFRDSSGSFESKGTTGRWWTISELNPENAWFYELNSENDVLIIDNSSKNYAYSVRLIKNIEVPEKTDGQYKETYEDLNHIINVDELTDQIIYELDAGNVLTAEALIEELKKLDPDNSNIQDMEKRLENEREAERVRRINQLTVEIEDAFRHNELRNARRGINDLEKIDPRNKNIVRYRRTLEKRLKPREEREQGLYIKINAGIANMEDPVTREKSGLEREFVYTVKIGGAFGLAIGYSFSNIRLEAEYLDQTNNWDCVSSYDDRFHGSISSNTILVNGYYDFINKSSLTPFIGFGLGYSKTEYFDKVHMTSPTKDNVLAYQGIIGIEYSISSLFALGTQFVVFRAKPEFFWHTDQIDYNTFNILLNARIVF